MTCMSVRHLEPSSPPAGAGARAHLASLADALIVAVAASLPWSTSATGIFLGLWLIALVPSLDIASVRRELGSAAGGLPVLLWVLAAIGMFWADVSWSERIDGMGGYHKLLMIPLLLAQFRRSGQAMWVVLAFLASAVLLLIVSWGLALVPGLTWRGRLGHVGVPVKNYIFQSEIFAIVAFGLIAQAVESWRVQQRTLAVVLYLVAMSFFANVAYVATGRTTLVAMAVLLLLFGLRQFGWKHVLAVSLTGAVTAGAFWASSPYLRQRVLVTVEQVRVHGSGEISSVGQRLEYWKQSAAFIAQAPVFGHGTGTIPQLFEHSTENTAPDFRTTNPHNQVLAVAIELGLPGAIVLIAMWIAHVGLFHRRTLIAWLGLIVVSENIVASLFNSHLFDFNNGWLYVVGLGVMGGMTLRDQTMPGEVGVANCPAGAPLWK